MVVSKNRGTAKSSKLMGLSIINHPFWGTYESLTARTVVDLGSSQHVITSIAVRLKGFTAPCKKARMVCDFSVVSRTLANLE